MKKTSVSECFRCGSGGSYCSQEHMKEHSILMDKNYQVQDQGFTIKDSGKREEFSSGMVRDTTEGKVDFGLALDGPMFERWAEHLTKGAKKYAKRNWMKAAGTGELERFKESALRHFLQWYRGDVDEDHGAAVFFNVNGYEYVKERMHHEKVQS